MHTWIEWIIRVVGVIWILGGALLLLYGVIARDGRGVNVSPVVFIICGGLVIIVGVGLVVAKARK